MHIACVVRGQLVGWELVLSLHHVDPSGLTEAVRLRGRLIYLLKHLPGS